MRTYTLIVSIVAHVCAACALLFTTVLATDAFPTPHDASTFVSIVTTPPPVAPPPARPRVEPVANRHRAPLEAPEGLRAEVERPAPIDIGDTVSDGIIGGFGTDAGLAVPLEPPPPPPPPPPAPPAPVRVGGIIEPPRKLSHVAPVYPELARTARVSGFVIIEATIDEEGNVRDTRVLRSIPLLDRAAVDAVRQWRFTPTVLNGQVIPVVMTVTVNFRLD
jgi:protein TonB